MQQTDATANRSQGSSLIVLACAFIALAILTSNLFWLTPAFLFCGLPLYRSSDRSPLKLFAILVCVALALAAAGLKLGKDMGFRDNAINSAQKAKP
jgi:hypothetical protein